MADIDYKARDRNTSLFTQMVNDYRGDMFQKGVVIREVARRELDSEQFFHLLQCMSNDLSQAQRIDLVTFLHARIEVYDEAETLR